MRPSLLTSMLLTCAILVGCNEQQQEIAEPKLRPVATMTVSGNSKSSYREFSGVTRAGHKSRLSFRIAGKVESLNVNVGDRLKENQLIASLNDSDSRLELQKAEAAVSQAKAEARNAKAGYGRIKKLYETETASRTELDNALSANQAAKAMVVQAEKQVALAQQKLSYAKLYNTLPGCVVAATEVESGENVSSGTPVVTVNCGDKVKVETNVAETFITHVRKGETVAIELNALKGKRLFGVVSEVGVDAQGTAYPVTIELQDPDKKILPGMAAIVYFKIVAEKYTENSVFLPLHVIQAERNSAFVFKVKDNGDGSASLVKTPVELGQPGADSLQVINGLKAGDVIVTKGISQLYDNMRVKYQAEFTGGQ